MRNDYLFLHDFRIHLPVHNGSHEQNVQWLAAAHTQAEATIRRLDFDFDPEAFRRQMERHIRRFGPSPKALGFRRSDVDEFLDERFEEKRLFPLRDNPAGAALGARMDAFAEIADRAVESLYPVSEGGAGSGDADPAGEKAPDDILHVTCTGYAAPSAVQKLVERRHWNERTRITHVYHMGCYASLPAIRIAAGYLASSASAQARCDLVHTEVCTLHFNPSRHDPEQLVVQSLFADGYIRYSLGRHADSGGRNGFVLLGSLERLLPDSLDDIGWIPGDFAMRMTLSRLVPEKIAMVLEPFLIALAEACGLKRDDLRAAAYAVHPGGPRVLDKVEEWLKLEPWQLAASREVLFERGNMSSATLPHIWARMLDHRKTFPGAPPETLVVSLAFGPGLTVYGSLMRRAPTR